MSRPEAQGWCPTAFHPMMSGDGMLLRVRPQFNRLSLEQALGLCGIAEQFGNGLIDFTSRAAVQIRGLTPASFTKALSALQSLSLVSQTASHEALRGLKRGADRIAPRDPKPGFIQGFKAFFQSRECLGVGVFHKGGNIRISQSGIEKHIE